MYCNVIISISDKTVTIFEPLKNQKWKMIAKLSKPEKRRRIQIVFLKMLLSNYLQCYK